MYIYLSIFPLVIIQFMNIDKNSYLGGVIGTVGVIGVIGTVGVIMVGGVCGVVGVLDEDANLQLP